MAALVEDLDGVTYIAEKKLEDVPTCSICLDCSEIQGVLECTHSYCYECIIRWSKTENSCPLCKKVFKTIDKIVTKPITTGTGKICLRQPKRKRVEVADCHQGGGSLSNFLGAALYADSDLLRSLLYRRQNEDPRAVRDNLDRISYMRRARQRLSSDSYENELDEDSYRNQLASASAYRARSPRSVYREFGGRPAATVRFNLVDRDSELDVYRIRANSNNMNGFPTSRSGRSHSDPHRTGGSLSDPICLDDGVSTPNDSISSSSRTNSSFFLPERRAVLRRPSLSVVTSGSSQGNSSENPLEESDFMAYEDYINEDGINNITDSSSDSISTSRIDSDTTRGTSSSSSSVTNSGTSGSSSGANSSSNAATNSPTYFAPESATNIYGEINRDTNINRNVNRNFNRNTNRNIGWQGSGPLGVIDLDSGSPVRQCLGVVDLTDEDELVCNRIDIDIYSNSNLNPNQQNSNSSSSQSSSNFNANPNPSSSSSSSSQEDTGCSSSNLSTVEDSLSSSSLNSTSSSNSNPSLASNLDSNLDNNPNIGFCISSNSNPDHSLDSGDVQSSNIEEYNRVINPAGVSQLNRLCNNDSMVDNVMSDEFLQNAMEASA